MKVIFITLVSILFFVVTVREQPEDAFIIVLGIAQDGGVPQAGTKEHAGWGDPLARRNVVCLGIVDPESGQRWMIEATPDFRRQLHSLDKIAPHPAKPGLAGIFLKIRQATRPSSRVT